MRILFLSGVVRAPFVGPIERLVKEGYDISILLEEEKLEDSLYPELAELCPTVELAASAKSKRDRILSILRQACFSSVRNVGKTWKLCRNFQFNNLRSAVVRASLLADYLRAFGTLGNTFAIIHSRDGGLSNRVAQLQAASFLRGHHVASFHGIDLMAYTIAQRRERYQLLFETASALTVQTEFMKGLILEAGAPVERVHVVPSAVDVGVIEWSGPNPYNKGETLKLVSVGRLIALKGHDDLIRTMALLLQKGIDATLDVYGDGPMKEELENQARTLNVDGQVTFHGAKPYLEVIQQMRSAHIFVHTPKALNGRETEAMGLVTLEAQLIGLPCVVTRSGGVPETVIEDVSAQIVPEASPNAIVNAILKLLNNPQDWEPNARKGREFVIANFSVERVVNEYKRIYRTVINSSVNRAEHAQ